MAQTTPPRREPAALITVTILLVVAIGGALWVPIYARSTPKLGDFPFFYWFQLIWVPVVAVLCWISYLLLRSRPTPGADTTPGNGEVAK
jgi:Protein of unknown function (DUF3311)